MGVPDCVTDIRLLFDPMALLITPRAMASGRSEFALPASAPARCHEQIGAPQWHHRSARQPFPMQVYPV